MFKWLLEKKKKEKKKDRSRFIFIDLNFLNLKNRIDVLIIGFDVRFINIRGIFIRNFKIKLFSNSTIIKEILILNRRNVKELEIR